MDGKFTGRGTESLVPTRGFCERQQVRTQALCLGFQADRMHTCVAELRSQSMHTHLAKHQHAMVPHLGSPKASSCTMARLRAALLQHGVEVGVGILAILFCGHCALTSPGVWLDQQSLFHRWKRTVLSKCASLPQLTPQIYLPKIRLFKALHRKMDGATHVRRACQGEHS